MQKTPSKKILFLSPYPVNKAPSQRLKYEQYYPFFEQEGYEITTSSFVDDAFWKIIYKEGNFFLKGLYAFKGYLRRTFDLFRVRKYDVVYIHLWATPLGIPLFERLFAWSAKKIVYDIDDLIFLGHSSDANKKSEFLKGKAKAILLMKKADHVITCTPKLDEFVREYNSNTTDISSTINTDIYKAKQNYELKEKIVLGWSGSHSTSRFLHLLDQVLIDLKANLNFELRVIGDADFKLDSISLKAIAWNADREVEDLSKIDIGLYPLPDEPWVYGKSGLKALQYMALGIPTIATAIGANYRVITDEENGFLVNTAEEWKERVIRLVNDKNLREKIGRKGREHVEQRFSLHANKDKYLHILKNLTS
ncbi:MAG TPA: glycosyltransferase family 4 protein [Bacteroidia bacterium]|jgi:glycosyltransferase involved in cell wall biosynthesis